MCFYADDYFVGKFNVGSMCVAGKDISVVKVVVSENSIFRSFYYGFRYSVGCSYGTEVHGHDGRILGGFHSYSDKIRLLRDVAGIRVSLDGSFFNDTFYKCDSRINSLYVMRCIIPKGSRYMRNDVGCYVSDSIRVVGFEPLSDVVEK